MRKRIIADAAPPDDRPTGADWLDLAALAAVEVTSEDPAHPVEEAFRPDGTGWRAAGPGAQTLRLVFDAPTRVRRVRLTFREDGVARTQEFVLRWSADGGRTYREVVRQQYTFSPPGTVVEIEDYRADLDGATVLELRVVPDIGGGRGRRVGRADAGRDRVTGRDRAVRWRRPRAGVTAPGPR